jgi:hypothetical protein
MSSKPDDEITVNMGQISASGIDIAGRDQHIAITGDGNVIGDASRSAVITVGRDAFIHYQDSTSTLAVLLNSLRQEIATQAPPGDKTNALEQIEDLEQSLQAENPDFGVFARVQKWFNKRLPELTGVLTSVLLHPTVREAVKKQQEVLEDELELHQRNLRKLEERVALYGPAEAPLHLLNQIDTERKRIQELESLIKQVNENVED